MEGQKYLLEDYLTNGQLCRERVNLSLNEECYVIDQSLIDEETGTHVLVPCIVVRIDKRKIGGHYYMLQAHDSTNDEKFNCQEENGIKFYKYLEDTSPLLVYIKEVIEK